ncbi:hypothetical protein HGRIS_006310 [Hohenbuehelia grisea]|uniref:Ig-like domain-containing protein n=1 Tax=Hohenbuehelia grisea TaxID=104357 RepID=A0ABR3JZI5_9AGAR
MDVDSPHGSRSEVHGLALLEDEGLASNQFDAGSEHGSIPINSLIAPKDESIPEHNDGLQVTPSESAPKTRKRKQTRVDVPQSTRILRTRPEYERAMTAASFNNSIIKQSIAERSSFKPAKNTTQVQPPTPTRHLGHAKSARRQNPPESTRHLKADPSARKPGKTLISGKDGANVKLQASLSGKRVGKRGPIKRAAVAPEALEATTVSSQESKLDADIPASACYQPSSTVSKKRAGTKRKADQMTADSEKALVMHVPEKGTRRASSKKSRPKPADESDEVPLSQVAGRSKRYKVDTPQVTTKPSTLRKNKRNVPRPSGSEQEAAASAEKIKWKVVFPMQVDAQHTSNRAQTSSQPRIWCRNKEILAKVLPELSATKARNGISLDGECTTIMLDDDSLSVNWLFGSAESMTVLDLTTTRSYTCPASSLLNIDTTPTVIAKNSSSPSTPSHGTSSSPSTPSHGTSSTVLEQSHGVRDALDAPFMFMADGTVLERTTSNYVPQTEGPSSHLEISSQSMPLHSDSEHPNGTIMLRSPSPPPPPSAFFLGPGDRSILMSSAHVSPRPTPPPPRTHLHATEFHDDLPLSSPSTALVQSNSSHVQPPHRVYRSRSASPDYFPCPDAPFLRRSTSVVQDQYPLQPTLPTSTHVAQPSVSDITLNSTPERSQECLPDSSLEKASGVLIPDINVDIQGTSDGTTPTTNATLTSPTEMLHCLPSILPNEILALVEAYTRLRPVIVVGPSHKLPLKLQDVYSYVYLGYYEVISVEETPCREYGPEAAPGIARGTVSWSFRLKWIAGGETSVDIDNTVDQEDECPDPWWGVGTSEDGSQSVSEVASTSRYEQMRPRKDPTNDGIRSEVHYHRTLLPLLPSQFHGQLTDNSDLMFPRGWHCPACGMLDEQRLMRRRQCTSVFCSQIEPIPCLKVDLETARAGRGQAMPMIMPNDKCSDDVYDSFANLSSKMPTFLYRPANNTSSDFVVDHIFSCNRPENQIRASELFSEIQGHVDLARISSALPIFQCAVGTDFVGLGAGVIPWYNAPTCLAETRDYIVDHAQHFGEQEIPTVDFNLCVLAWVSTGSRKETHPLKAKERPLCVLCLGNNVLLSITPKRYLDGPDPNDEAPMQLDLNSLITFDEGLSTARQDQPLCDETMDETIMRHAPDFDKPSMVHSGRAGHHGDALARKGPLKREKSEATIHIAMVHGDILILHGDEFLYTVKRSGTAMLVFVQ